jgi:hypothetical protein
MYGAIPPPQIRLHGLAIIKIKAQGELYFRTDAFLIPAMRATCLAHLILLDLTHLYVLIRVSVEEIPVLLQPACISSTEGQFRAPCSLGHSATVSYAIRTSVCTRIFCAKEFNGLLQKELNMRNHRALVSCRQLLIRRAVSYCTASG